MTLDERIELLGQLGQALQAPSETLDATVHRAGIHNQWFTEKNVRIALRALVEKFLDLDALKDLAGHYRPSNPIEPKKVGIIMAGNIPLVGFHDLLCTFLCGHHAKIKLSEKDDVLLPYLIQQMVAIDARCAPYFEVIERLSGFNAVIATGSNNSARYFEAYFGKYPNIIRKNRNGVAVLDGAETEADLLALGQDIFQYFGLGCRNVAKLYVPEGYDFEFLMETLHQFNELALHNKYKNNFDYNFTLYILNQRAHLSNGCVLLVEDESLHSRIASLHFEYYADTSSLEEKLRARAEEIQCIVAKKPVGSLPVIEPGKAQNPGLMDYADGVDTMQFLLSIS
ncbi:MAG: acyl-CoA reductase [Bacteroidota bacterium]